jgi:osmotically inducible protein OsmC
VTRTIYTAEARVTGGRDKGRGRTPDGRLDVALRLPRELGGDGDGVNPEQLLAVGYAGCFEAVMTFAAQKLKISVDRVTDVVIDAKVMLISCDDGTFKLGAQLDVELPSIEDPAQASELVRAAHRICPYSKATRGNIDVRFTVNGLPVTEAPASLR